MLKTLGIVEASFRSASFRASAMRRCGGRSVLEWVVRRVTDAEQLGGVIVVACDAIEYRDLYKLVPTDVPIFQNSAPDMLTRFARALEEFPAEAAVRIQGNNVLIDPSLIDRLVTAGQSDPDCDYASFGSRDGRPLGLYAEWFRVRALHRANRSAKDMADREQVTQYLRSHPRKFKMRLIPAPQEIDREDVRLSITNDDDWDHVLAICDALGPEALDWQGIARLLDHQPALRKPAAAPMRACAGS